MTLFLMARLFGSGAVLAVTLGQSFNPYFSSFFRSVARLSPKY